MKLHKRALLVLGTLALAAAAFEANAQTLPGIDQRPLPLVALTPQASSATNARAVTGFVMPAPPDLSSYATRAEVASSSGTVRSWSSYFPGTSKFLYPYLYTINEDSTLTVTDYTAYYYAGFSVAFGYRYFQPVGQIPVSFDTGGCGYSPVYKAIPLYSNQAAASGGAPYDWYVSDTDRVQRAGCIDPGGPF